MKTKILASVLGLLGSTLLASAAHAAPMPGTSTSKLVAPQLGLFRSPHGFQIGAGDSGWVHGEAPKDSKFIATVYKSNSAASKATLTVRVDKLEKDMNIEKYVQKWMKEYPKYGFDVLGSTAFTQNKNRGFVLDLVNRDNSKQHRQVVFLKNQKAVILTCRDSSDKFKDALKSCNQIIRTFEWTN